MALQSKTITANGTKGHHYFSLTVNEDSISTANNGSYMSFNFNLGPINTGWDWRGWSDRITYTVNIGDKSYSGTIPEYNGYSVVNLKSESSIFISHNNSGDKTINISFSVTDNAGQTYTCGNASRTDIMILRNIPRASSVSVADTYIESPLSITINKADKSFTHSLFYSFGSSNPITGTIVTKTSADIYKGFQLPASFYSKIRGSKQGTCTIECRTYSGDSLVGTTYKTFKAMANPEKCKPTITSVEIKDLSEKTIELTGDANKIIENASIVQITIQGSFNNYGLANYIKFMGNKITLASSEITTSNGTQTFTKILKDYIISKSEISIELFDRRNFSTEKVYQSEDSTGENYFNLIHYTPLRISADVSRNTPTDGKIKLNYFGDYSETVFSTTNTNTLEVSYRFKERTATEYGEWIALSPVKNASNETFAQEIATTVENQFDYQKIYDFELNAKDKVKEITLTGITLSKGIPVFWWDDSNVYIGENSQVATIDNYEKYSTDEIQIGTWIDGKAIYRKVFAITDLPTQGSPSTIETKLYKKDVDKIVRLTGTLVGDVSVNSLPSSDMGLLVKFLRNFASTDGRWQIVLSTSVEIDFTGFTAYVMIEYTK